MRYDPFTARNLLRGVSLIGLVVMMTEAAPPTDSLAIGLLCLMSAGILSLFPGGGKPVPTTRRAVVSRADPSVQDAQPQPVVRAWTPPGKAPAKPALEPHPAIFATVAGRTTGMSSRRRE